MGLPSKDEFIVTICSVDRRSNITSQEFLYNVAFHLFQMGLKKSIYFNKAYGLGLPMVRTSALEKARLRYPDEKEAWMLWFDSDIEIHDDPRRMAEAIAYAEANNLAFGFDVKCTMVDDNWNLRSNCFKEWERPYTDQELYFNGAEDFELKLGHTGMGSCYVKTPLDYKFHATGGEGEDTNFWKDNKDIDCRFVSIDNEHFKTIGIFNRPKKSE